MRSKLARKIAIVLGVSTAPSLGGVACGDAVSLEADVEQAQTMDFDAGADANRYGLWDVDANVGGYRDFDAGGDANVDAADTGPTDGG